MSKIKQKLSNLISDMKMWSHNKVIAPILSPLKGSVSYLKNAPILPGGLSVSTSAARGARKPQVADPESVATVRVESIDGISEFSPTVS